MLTLTLPYPPSVNSYLKTANMTTRFISKKGLAFRSAVRMAVPANLEPMTGRLQVNVMLHARDKIRRDIDNPLKILMDSLQRAGVFKDDSQIDKMLVERGDIIKGGMCIVTIEPYLKDEL